MDLRQLEYVVAVAEERSFTRAAGRCHVVQSALSASVARLERELGMPLFHRTSRTVGVTPAGELLLPHARALLRGVEVAREELAAHAGLLTGRLRLGMVGSAGRSVPRAEEALVEFSRRHPAVEIAVRDTGSRHMAGQVRDGDLDLALVGLSAAQVPSGVVHHLLADEPLVAVVPRDCALAGRGAVSVAELAAAGPLVEMRGESGLRLQVDEAFARAGVVRAVASELGSSEAVVRFAGLGLGAAVVPASAAEGADVAVLALDDPAARHPLGLVHAAPEPAAPGARAFRDLLLRGATG